jgi:hypothetical protein
MVAVEHAKAPRRQDQQTGTRKKDADDLDGERALRAGKTGRDDRDQQGGRQYPDQHERRHHDREQRTDRAGHPIGLAPVTPRDERCVHRDEGCGERTLPEQVLQEVGDAECRVEGVGSVRLQAEVVREDAQPNKPRDTAQENAGCDEKGFVHSPSDDPSSGASPSVPFARFIK